MLTFHLKGRTFQIAVMHVIAGLLVLALLSVFVFSGIASDPKTYQKQIQSLDERQATVMQLTAASAAASTALSMLPGDTATPIANELADLTSYFLLVLSAILLEKYMMAIFGALAFRWLIPAALILYAAYLIWGTASLKALAKKLIMFSLVIVMVIPLSVSLADRIQGTFDIAIDPGDELLAALPEETIPETTAPEGEGASWIENAWTSITATVGQVGDSISETVSGVTDSIANNTVNVLANAKDTLNHLVEAIAVMIVTCCLIPVGVMIFLFWVVKMIFEMDFNRGSASVPQLEAGEAAENP